MNDSQKSNTTNSIDLNKELLESDYNLEIIDINTLQDNRYYEVNDCFSSKKDMKRQSWLNDNITIKCLHCNKDFTIFRRKHHCRNCGGIFCYECSSNFIQIPKFIDNCPKKHTNPYDIKNYIPDTIKKGTLNILGYNIKEERVCIICYVKIHNIMEISDLIKIFSNIILDVPTYKKIALVNKSWNKISKYYLSSFQEIQYYLPDHVFNDNSKERELLWVNRFYLAGHSKWLILLIKSIDWNKISESDKKEVIKILNSPRICSCKDIFCGPKCTEIFTPEDSIICLYPYIDNSYIRRYIFKCLSNAMIKELLCYLPYLVHSLRYYYKESDNNKDNNKDKDNIYDITEYLIHISKHNYVFFNYFYWELNLHINFTNKTDDYLQVNKSLYDNIKRKLLNSVNKGFKDILINSMTFTNNLSKIMEKEKYNVNIKKIIKEHLQDYDYYDKYPISLPIQPSQVTIGLDINNIEFKNSNTKPIILNFNCIKKENNKYDKDNKDDKNNKDDKDNLKKYNFSVLYKSEDVRKDYIISKIISIMDIIIQKELEIDLNLVHYNILPIDENSGYVEIVPDSETIYDIKSKFKFTIQNYIIENNSNEPIEQLRDKFVKSCAGYCVISYLLGIGDRHLDNIMIKKEGILFHIDYGYILGNEPKFFTKKTFGMDEIRLTSDMIDMMGGLESKHYKKFVELCNTCFNCLRQHSNLFYILLSMLHFYKPDIDGKNTYNKEIIQKYIIDKFIPYESNTEAKIHINTKISNNTHQSIGTSISDFFHYYNKEFKFNFFN